MLETKYEKKVSFLSRILDVARSLAVTNPKRAQKKEVCQGVYIM